jgi:glycerol-3-phosphate dehydrogenase (NAD(P)+)
LAKIGVAGTTSWGTTLAIIAARHGLDASLWARTGQEAEQLRSDAENRRFLPGVQIPPGVEVAASADEAFGDAELLIIAVPSRTMRTNARAIRDSIHGDAVIVSATKGLELGSGKRMSEVLAEELPSHFQERICSLSGPNLASEIVMGKPSMTVVASANAGAAEHAQSLITSSLFRVYTNADMIGVELGGALKNIIAVGAGVCDGLVLGENAKAAFMTRGLAEIARLGLAAGAELTTFAGLAGVGDLIATCSSRLSRNHHLGEELATGKSLEEIRAAMIHVAEGVDTTAAVVVLAERLNVEMPIASATYDVLFNGITIDTTVSGLLGRDPVPEWPGSGLG